MKIALLAATRDTKFSFNIAYWDFARRYGSVELIEPRQDGIINADLLILPGGEDVYPLRYGEPPIASGAPNMDYEYFDALVLPKYIKAGIPVFGICRGLQTLNVMFNGSLHQHVFEPYSSYGRNELVHYANVVGTNNYFKVNSLHHQAIKKLGDGFHVTLEGYTKEKDKKNPIGEKLHIEGIAHEHYKIAAVQFHPEELTNTKEATQIVDFVDEQINQLLQ